MTYGMTLKGHLMWDHQSLGEVRTLKNFLLPSQGHIKDSRLQEQEPTLECRCSREASLQQFQRPAPAWHLIQKAALISASGLRDHPPLQHSVLLLTCHELCSPRDLRGGSLSPAFSRLGLNSLCLLVGLMYSALEHICGFSWKYSKDSIIT